MIRGGNRRMPAALSGRAQVTLIKARRKAQKKAAKQAARESFARAELREAMTAAQAPSFPQQGSRQSTPAAPPVDKLPQQMDSEEFRAWAAERLAARATGMESPFWDGLRAGS